MTPLRLSLPRPIRGRAAAVDELKGVGIILIILYHAGGVLGWTNDLHGEVGVDIFVILSGVGLALGAAEQPAGKFLWRRFLRIYPAYWIALTLWLVLGYSLLGFHFHATDIALHYLGLHAWFGSYHGIVINDSFWFITLIVSLYVLYLPVRRLLDRPDVLLLAGAAISFLAALAYFEAESPVGFATVSLRIPGFFLGLLAGRLLRDGVLELPLTAPLGIAAAILIYLPSVFGFMFTAVWLGGALMLLYVFALGPALSLATRAALAYVGTLSLELFLLHQPLIREYNVYVLQRCLHTLAFGPLVLAAGMAAGLAAAFGLSVLLHRLLRPRETRAGRGRVLDANRHVLSGQEALEARDREGPEVEEGGGQGGAGAALL
jgi:peptidoglycan/LPS O-acetylase OafA/YrhL